MFSAMRENEKIMRVEGRIGSRDSKIGWSFFVGARISFDCCMQGGSIARKAESVSPYSLNARVQPTIHIGNMVERRLLSKGAKMKKNLKVSDISSLYEYLFTYQDPFIICGSRLIFE